MTTCQHDDRAYKGRSNVTCTKKSASYYTCPAGTSSDGVVYPEKIYGGIKCAGDFPKNILYPSKGYNYVNRYYTKCYRDRPKATNMSLESKVACCLGKNTREDQCPATLCRGSGNCDQVMLDYCKNRPDDPNCGCALDDKYYGALKTIGPLQCIDKRCTNPSAYKLTSQKDSCNLTQCIVGDVTLTADDMANIDDFALSQNCGDDFLSKLENQEKQSSEEPSENNNNNSSNDNPWFSWINPDPSSSSSSNDDTISSESKDETNGNKTNIGLWVSIIVAIISIILGYFFFIR